ncbi:MAG: glycosyltransferase, partial [Gemmataceae bacterium]|nr:glycosyltransferase [Gemmata sp.]MDW8199383.1 glycosyltransferase [Gemmataceae bacterium]
MRVLITDLPLLRDRKKSGVGYYAQELVRGLREVAGPDFVYSFPTRWLDIRQNWLNKQCARFEKIAHQPGLLARIERTVRGRFLVAVRKAFPIMQHPYQETIRRNGCVLYHEPNYIPRPLELPTVVSVHDLSAILYPEWHPPERVRFFEKEFLRGLKQASHLLAISEFGKQEIIRYLGWPAERVSVSYMGVRAGLGRVGGVRLQRAL